MSIAKLQDKIIAYPGTRREALRVSFKENKRSDFANLTEYAEFHWRAKHDDLEFVTTVPAETASHNWQYEMARIFCSEFNLLIAKLIDFKTGLSECNASTCPRMNATDDWYFLCAAHRKPQECIAIDYIRHTIDASTALLLNRGGYFSVDAPSSSPTQFASSQNQQGKNLTSLFRRIYRIFSHLFFHHRKIFEEFEKENSFCKKFTAFALKFELITKDSIIIPTADNVSNSTLPVLFPPSPPATSSNVLESVAAKSEIFHEAEELLPEEIKED